VPGFEVVALIVRFIPERWDGLGPQGLSGHRIPLASRILAACNAIRVLAANRAHDGVAVEMALRRVQAASGSIFDPTVVAALTHELVGDMPHLADDATTAADWARADAQYAGVR
jgi:response regulator RpfG family c-di-GMP phosphodiesterase